jgi:FKBP-type peptidyl-prolyl cis-trans isomerase SlyD
LAGTTLNFDVTVRDIREASAEEIAHGHVHGPEGHDH